MEESVCDDRAEMHLFSTCALLFVAVRPLFLIVAEWFNEFKID